MIIIDSKTWIIGAVLAVTRRRVTDGDGRRTRLSDASVCVMGLGRIYRAASGAAEYRSHRDHCIVLCWVLEARDPCRAAGEDPLRA